MYGIDFGTSNTVVTVGDGSGSRLLDLGEGPVMPSLLYFDRDGWASVGAEAAGDYAAALERFRGTGDLYSRFRFFQALKLALKDPAFKGTSIFGSFWPAERLAGLYLREVRKRADQASGVPTTKAVIGRPVMLTEGEAGRDDERVLERYRAACAFAGFSEVAFVAEPVAAAASLLPGASGTALVFDFGGGTLDVAVAEFGPGNDIRILSSAGRDLGGYRLNEDVSRARIIDYFGARGKFRTMRGSYLDMPRWITDQVASFYALPLGDIAATRRMVKELVSDARPIDKPRLRGLLAFLDGNESFRLFEELDKAKIGLSSAGEASIAYDLPPHVSVREILSREDFEGIIEARVREAEAVVDEALASAGLSRGDVSGVVRVGGSSRTPAFAAMLERLFPGRVSEGAVFTSIASGLYAAHEAGLSTR